MWSTDILARGNKPHSAAGLTERLDGIGVKFRQQLSELVERVGDTGLARANLESLTSSLRSACAEAGRSAFVAIVESRDVAAPTVELGDHTCRFKEAVEKKWFTPFGVAAIRRRTYASSDRSCKAVPLDATWGMADRFLTPEVEEMVAFASGLVTPCEVEQLLKKALPESPSATAIKRAIRDVGDYLEQERDKIESRIEQDAPLDTKGDSLIASWDGAMVPLRSEPTCTEWKEAGVARVSIYDNPGSPELRPEMRDSRYLARMPEPKMATLVDQVAAQIAGLREHHEFENVAVICDGKDSIWKAASRPEFEGAVFILDFYHAAEHLSAASNAIFGEGEPRAQRWFRKRRHDLRHFKGSIVNVLRALKRYFWRLKPGSARYEVVRKVIKHFTKNQQRMRYREFVDMGVPIGSGHVESAAKNIIGQRLKRSGMRWSSDGGQRVLNLRTLVKDGRWPAAWTEYRDRAAA